VERRPPELLLDVPHGQAEPTHHGDRLLLGMSPGGVEVEVPEGAERQHVELLAAFESVEPPGHVVSAAAPLEQPALAAR